MGVSVRLGTGRHLPQKGGHEVTITPGLLVHREAADGCCITSLFMGQPRRGGPFSCLSYDRSRARSDWVDRGANHSTRLRRLEPLQSGIGIRHDMTVCHGLLYRPREFGDEGLGALRLPTIGNMVSGRRLRSAAVPTDRWRGRSPQTIADRPTPRPFRDACYLSFLTYSASSPSTLQVWTLRFRPFATREKDAFNPRKV